MASTPRRSPLPHLSRCTDISFFLCRLLLDCPLSLNPTLSPGCRMPTSLGICGGTTVLPEGRCPCVRLALCVCVVGRRGGGEPIPFCREAAPGDWERTPGCRVTDPEPHRFTKEIPGSQVPMHTPLHLIYKLFAQFKHAQGFPKSSLCSYRFLPTSVLYGLSFAFQHSPSPFKPVALGTPPPGSPWCCSPCPPPPPSLLLASSWDVSLCRAGLG